MHTKLWPISVIAICVASTIPQASAGVIADIKVSREVPDMVAEVRWDAPEIDTGKSFEADAVRKAVLWQSSITVTQQAAVLRSEAAINGETPVVVPAGALFTGWRLDTGDQAMCSNAAELAEKRGKPRYAVCLFEDGSLTVRKHSKRQADATSGSATGRLELVAGYSEEDNIRTRPWNGPVLHFSYKQSGERAALIRRPTNVGKIQAVAQLELGSRLVIGDISGNQVELELRRYDLSDYTVPLEKRKNSGRKIAEAMVNLSGGSATAVLGDAEFEVSRLDNGKITANAINGDQIGWAIDEATGRLLISGLPYTIGAQER